MYDVNSCLWPHGLSGRCLCLVSCFCQEEGLCQEGGLCQVGDLCPEGDLSGETPHMVDEWAVRILRNTFLFTIFLVLNSSAPLIKTLTASKYFWRTLSAFCIQAFILPSSNKDILHLLFNHFNDLGTMVFRLK